MSLKDRLIRQIRMDGPMPVSAYMQTCLHDPTDGYYANGAGLGRDFITAPETSQMFGELIGLWVVAQWRALGRPDGINLVEIGGGRGTLMADALRAMRQFLPMESVRLILIEASAELRRIQGEALAEFDPQFVDALTDIPAGPTLLIANEFLDCLPARQFVCEDDIWRERVVGLDEAGELAFGIDRSDLRAEEAAAIAPTKISREAEIQPGLEGVVDALAARTEDSDRFYALFIDYGPEADSPEDSLRAYKRGKQLHPLADPGGSDLTVDVDFTRFSKLSSDSGLAVSGPVTQGEFLGALELQDRLDLLIKSFPNRAEDLFSGAQKLVAPDRMGTRFKVICLASAGLPAPIGFGRSDQ
jgi:SAM-dependent MidA family methyltransferase